MGNENAYEALSRRLERVSQDHQALGVRCCDLLATHVCRLLMLWSLTEDLFLRPNNPKTAEYIEGRYG